MRIRKLRRGNALAAVNLLGFAQPEAMPRISTRSSACRLGISACGAVLRPGSGRSLGSQPGYLPMRLGTSCARCWQLTRRMHRWRASLGAELFSEGKCMGVPPFFLTPLTFSFSTFYIFLQYIGVQCLFVASAWQFFSGSQLVFFPVRIDLLPRRRCSTPGWCDISPMRYQLLRL